MDNDEIDLKQLLELFWNKKVLILIVVLIAVIMGYIYTSFLVKPKYTSSTTLILAQRNSADSTGTITSTDVTLNDKLIDTYKEIATSNSVVRTVVSNLGLASTKEAEIKKKVNVTAVTGTQILKVSVTDSNADMATKIANEMGQVFSKRIADIYKIDNVSIVDEAETTGIPSNINHKKDMLIFLVGGIVVAVALVLLINMLDNSIKSSTDIERALNLNILAEIPECDFSSKR